MCATSAAMVTRAIGATIVGFVTSWLMPGTAYACTQLEALQALSIGIGTWFLDPWRESPVSRARCKNKIRRSIANWCAVSLNQVITIYNPPQASTPPASPPLAPLTPPASPHQPLLRIRPSPLLPLVWPSRPVELPRPPTAPQQSAPEVDSPPGSCFVRLQSCSQLEALQVLSIGIGIWFLDPWREQPVTQARCEGEIRHSIAKWCDVTSDQVEILYTRPSPFTPPVSPPLPPALQPPLIADRPPVKGWILIAAVASGIAFAWAMLAFILWRICRWSGGCQVCIAIKLVCQLVWILLRLEVCRMRRPQKKLLHPAAAAPDIQLPSHAKVEQEQPSRETSFSSRHESLQANKISVLHQLKTLGLRHTRENQSEKMNNEKLTIQEDSDKSLALGLHSKASPNRRDIKQINCSHEDAVNSSSRSSKERNTQRLSSFYSVGL